MTEHKIKKIRKGEYEYRGFTVERDENVSAGYYGAWLGGGRKFVSDARKSVIEQIDVYYEKRERAKERQWEEPSALDAYTVLYRGFTIIRNKPAKAWVSDMWLVKELQIEGCSIKAIAKKIDAHCEASAMPTRYSAQQDRENGPKYYKMAIIDHYDTHDRVIAWAKNKEEADLIVEALNTKQEEK